jgi:hypothetical protein
MVTMGGDAAGEWRVAAFDHHAVRELLDARADGSQVRNDRRNAITLFDAKLARASDSRFAARSRGDTRE